MVATSLSCPPNARDTVFTFGGPFNALRIAVARCHVRESIGWGGEGASFGRGLRPWRRICLRMRAAILVHQMRRTRGPAHDPDAHDRSKRCPHSRPRTLFYTERHADTTTSPGMGPARRTLGARRGRPMLTKVFRSTWPWRHPTPAPWSTECSRCARVGIGRGGALRPLPRRCCPATVRGHQTRRRGARASD